MRSTARGALVIPGGGLTSLARIEMIRQAGVTTLLCTPTYALRLAEVAAEHNINLADSPVEKIIVAGEPGGSVPATRERIETAWNAARRRSQRRDRSRAVGIRRCGRPRTARQRGRVHRRIRVGRNGPPGRGRRALALDPHGAGPSRGAGHSLSHGRPGATAFGAARARIVSCCSKAASSAGRTTW